MRSVFIGRAPVPRFRLAAERWISTSKAQQATMKPHVGSVCADDGEEMPHGR